MRSDLSDFLIKISTDEIRSAIGELSGPHIFGNPYHKSTEGLITAYNSKTISQYLVDEGVRSCGNYLLADSHKSGCTIITAPGYAGGYYLTSGDTTYVASDLSSLLQSIDNKYINLDKLWGHYYVNNSLQSLPPSVTPFENVYRLPPGSVINAIPFEVDISDYIFDEKVLSNAPDSLSSALDIIAQNLQNEPITVMFSGGRDSLALYLALKNKRGSGDVQAVTVDWRPGSKAQGPYQAVPVANSLGIDLDIISFSDGWPTRKEPIYSGVMNSLSRDFIRPISPHYALADYENSSHSVIAHGQNMDALTGINMGGPSSWKSYIFRDPSILRRLRNFGYLFVSIFLNNIQYTDNYLNNKPYRSAYLQTIVPLFKILDKLHPGSLVNDFCSTETVIDRSEAGILESIVRKTAPNTVPNHHNQEFQKHIKTCISRSIGEDSSTAKLAKFIKYRTYSHTSNKLISGLPAGSQTPRPMLLSMWGPLSSYFNSRKLSMRNALQNKIEISEYIKKETGKSYGSIKYSDNDTTSEPKSISEYKSTSTSVFVDDLMSSQSIESFFDTGYDRSPLDVLNPISEEIYNALEKEHTGFDQINKHHRILNLKYIVENSLSDPNHTL